MGILSRFADLMKANLNTVLEKTEGKNADKLLEQYIREARENLDTVKSETAGVIAEEMAAGRRVASFDEEIAKLAGYAEKAVLAGNDDDAKKFLAGKDAAEGKKADAERAYAQAQLNSDRMRQLTKKLSEDFVFCEQERVDGTHRAVRFCTSWATRKEAVDALCARLRELCGTLSQSK